jgi:hypothetical protein
MPALEDDQGGRDLPDRRERPRITQPSVRPPGHTLKPEAELKAWIIHQFKKADGCADLEVDFVLVANARPASHEPSWYLRAVRGWGGWSQPCRKAFRDVVAQAQDRFDLQ